MRRTALALGLLVVVLPVAAPAVELDRGDLRLEILGSLRTLYQRTRAFDAEGVLDPNAPSTTRDPSALLLVRPRIDVQGVWRDRLYGQFVGDFDMVSGSGLDSFPYQLGREIGIQTWFHWDHTITDDHDPNMSMLIYRAWLRWESQRVEVTLGRQRIPLGQGRLWNPIDLFNPIPPLAIEGDQRVGVDAARARLRLRPGLWVEAIWAPQNDPHESRSALRAEVSTALVDAAVMVGYFEQDWVLGGDTAGNLGGAAYRFEATWTNVRGDPEFCRVNATPPPSLACVGAPDRFWQVVASLDYTFSVGTGIYALVEHLYNGNVIDAARRGGLGSLPPGDPLELIATEQLPFLDRITTAVRNQTGVELGYDLHPLVRFDLLSIYDWQGPSVAVFPVVSWAARSDLELRAGVQLFYGPDSRDPSPTRPGSTVSQYGDATNVVFVQVDLFF